MKHTYIFDSKDNFESIILKCPLSFNKQCLNLTPLLNGKSSFGFSVLIDGVSYVFKFPRTKFQHSYLKYEKTVSQYLNKKLACRIPQIDVFLDELNRPYIVYKQIVGTDMSNLDLSHRETERLCKQLVQNLLRIHSINKNELNFSIITKKQSLLSFASDFHYEPKFSMIEDLLNEDSVIHGDFHKKNIILDDENNLSGLIDFTTFSTGSIYFDIGHFVFSTKESIWSVFLKEYQVAAQVKIDDNKLSRVIDFLDDLIKKHYLPYINAQK